MFRAPRMAALLVAATMAAPVAANADEDAFSSVEAKIRELAPSAKMIAVSETPIDGILQVQVNSEIVYASADGKYLIQGRIVDMDTREDLTDRAKASLRKEKIGDLTATKQITFGPDTPDYDLLVFTDIDCGYCRKLHDQIDEYTEAGIAIHYLAFPRAGIGSHSFDKAVSVWCADDPNTALTDAKNDIEPEPRQCENPVAEQYELGREVGVTGTPALITMDGTLIPGYMPPAQLRARLDSMQAEEAEAGD